MIPPPTVLNHRAITLEMKPQSKSPSLRQIHPFSSMCSHPTSWNLKIWLLWRQVCTTIKRFRYFEKCFLSCLWREIYNVVQAACKFFRSPANFEPDATLSLPEMAAYDTCGQKAIFKSMKPEEKQRLKQRCGGSWKLVLLYLLIGEKNYRRGKSQVIAGPGHSIAVTGKGDVYSFGTNSSGQLGLGNVEEQCKPCLIR